ncbi:hypothetical protein I656_01256 [Geobacillus sp. WSUCF1]|nr:hypothetical protein I656_01256 [Geobacillus sp. WSUCF1]
MCYKRGTRNELDYVSQLVCFFYAPWRFPFCSKKRRGLALWENRDVCSSVNHH